MSIIGDVVGRRITFEELSPDEFRRETEGSWPRPAVDMLLAAWAATMGRPAFVTSTVSDILGVAAAIVSPVGRRSRHRVCGRSNPFELIFATVRHRTEGQQGAWLQGRRNRQGSHADRGRPRTLRPASVALVHAGAAGCPNGQPAWVERAWSGSGTRDMLARHPSA